MKIENNNNGNGVDIKALYFVIHYNISHRKYTRFLAYTCKTHLNEKYKTQKPLFQEIFSRVSEPFSWN